MRGSSRTRSVAGAFAAAIVIYGCLVAASTYPVMASLQERLAGEGGDAYLYLWGTWWFGEAVADSGQPLYESPLLLHPFGADLLQHDFPLMANLMPLVCRRAGLNLVGSYNVSLCLAMWLNACAVFLLAFMLLPAGESKTSSVSSRFLASLTAGSVFSFSAYFWSRSRGHYTLLHAYGLPLLALCLEKARLTGRQRWNIGAGCALVLLALCNYYYFVYAVIYTVVFWIYHAFEIHPSLLPRSAPRRRTAATLAVIGSLALLLAVGVAVTGGWDFELSGRRVKLHGTANPLMVWWLSWVASLLCLYRPSLRISLRDGPLGGSALRTIAITFLPLALLTPLFLSAMRLVLSGDFAAQPLGWKSGPHGIYPLTLVLPNLYNLAWGETLRGFLSTHSWDVMEGLSASLGAVSLAVVLRTGSWRGSGWWLFGFSSATLLAFGPFLRLAPGLEHGPVLPFWVLRYVPVVGGARVPGRWIVVALLCWGMLMGRAILSLRSAKLRAAILIAILLEAAPPVMWTSSTAIPKVYQRITGEPRLGAVLELPFGVSDGRGSWGVQFPPERLYFQTIHAHPLIGGYLSRVPDRIFGSYRDEPVIAELVRLQSAGGVTELPAAAFDDLCRRWGIRWVVVEESKCSDALRSVVESWMGTPVIAVDGRSLFRISSW